MARIRTHHLVTRIQTANRDLQDQQLMQRKMRRRKTNGLSRTETGCTTEQTVILRQAGIRLEINGTTL